MFLCGERTGEAQGGEICRGDGTLVTCLHLIDKKNRIIGFSCSPKVEMKTFITPHGIHQEASTINLYGKNFF